MARWFLALLLTMALGACSDGAKTVPGTDAATDAADPADVAGPLGTDTTDTSTAEPETAAGPDDVSGPSDVPTPPPPDAGQDATVADVPPSDVAADDTAGPSDTASPVDTPTPDGIGPTDAGAQADGDVLELADVAEPPSDTGGGPDAEEDATDATDAGAPDVEQPIEYPWEPEGTCGMAPYEWLPSTEVGALISYHAEPAYSLSPDLILMLLENLGYPGALPVEHSTRVYHIRYLTQDRGQLVEATAMVGVPDVTTTATDVEPFPTVLFLHPTLGYAASCSPSQGLYGAAAAVLPASLGFISVAPDLLGLCGSDEPCGDFHPYLIGEATAIAALDAVRAAETLIEELTPELMVEPDGRLVPWGGSQGGHAALFVDRYAPIYAPELDIDCTVAIVPPSNLAGQALHALSTFGSSTKLGTAFLAAALLWYQPSNGAAFVFNADGPVDFAKQVVETFPTTCSDDDMVKGAKSLEDLFNPTFLTAMQTGDFGPIDPWGCIAIESSLPFTSAPLLTDSQILFILGSNDEIVDHDTEIAAFQVLCSQGYALELVDCQSGTHVDTAIDTLPIQLEWVGKCLNGNGIPPEVECQVTDPIVCK